MGPTFGNRGVEEGWKQRYGGNVLAVRKKNKNKLASHKDILREKIAECVRRPTDAIKETSNACKRDLITHVNRPNNACKRDLLTRVKEAYKHMLHSSHTDCEKNVSYKNAHTKKYVSHVRHTKNMLRLAGRHLRPLACAGKAHR
jgi:hypothetical protein